MNKTYQKPATVVVRIEQHLMTSTSTMGFGSNVNTASGADSRRGSTLWDDDEE